MNTPHCYECSTYYPEEFIFCPVHGSVLGDYLPEKLLCYKYDDSFEDGHNGNYVENFIYKTTPIWKMYYGSERKPIEELVTEDKSLIKQLVYKPRWKL